MISQISHIVYKKRHTDFLSIQFIIHLSVEHQLQKRYSIVEQAKK